MLNKNNNVSALTRYLLGQLSEAEQTAIEESYFTDADYFEQLKIAEAELLDDYVNERLSSADRQAFEKTYLSSPSRRRRATFAAVWKTYVANQPLIAGGKAPEGAFFRKIKRPWIWVPATAALLLLIGGFWLGLQNQNLNVEIEKAIAQESARIDAEIQEKFNAAREFDEPIARENLPPPSPAPQPKDENQNNHQLIASIVLNPGGVRSSSRMNTLEVSATTKTIRLVLPFKSAESYKNYDAVIEKPDGAPVFSEGNLPVQKTAAQNQVIWKLAAGVLNEGDYLITLRGINAANESEDVADYQLRIRKK
ncbi:MAG: hypothetical protein AB1757_17245 [Acidobacteriota bacterium]